MLSSLAVLGLMPTPDDPSSGLVPIRGRKARLPIDEEAAMLDAAAIKGLDYVYFRRFNDGRSSQVAAYVVDNEKELLSEDELAKLHKEVWLHGTAPLLYVGWQTRVDVLSCARGPDFWKNNQCHYGPAVKIPVLEEELPGLSSTSANISDAIEKQKRFSAQRLADGTFWEDTENSKLANADKSAHRRLIEAVVSADRDVNGDQNPILRRLLLLTVLVKYLEDRGVFPGEGWFGRFHKGARSFFDLLQNGAVEEVRSFLSFMENKFNGDVFALPEDNHQKLTTKELRRFADLVSSRTIGNQRYLWEQYSFRHLPVEVLSHLYQRFAQKGKGAIFTPPFVASLLLDYALPYCELNGNERVFDPTCGSGVFLVGAFRRLVHIWRHQNNWKKPDVKTLKTILKRSIFGVDLQEEALHLAAFGLALAVCDALLPKVIWEELRFEKLESTNLICQDFFEYVEGQTARFDVVLGNPPFQSVLTAAGKRLNKSASAVRGKVPDNQAAYLVAEQVMNLLQNGGRMCLIQPSSVLYNEKVASFRKRFFSRYLVESVLDFSSVRGLFDKADTKIVTLVCQNKSPTQQNRVNHLTFRRTVSVQEEIGFELDHYDRHVISQKQAIELPFTWKINLLGGGRLHSIVARLKDMGKLGDFISHQVAHKSWDYGEGFIAAKSGRRTKEPWLTGQKLLPSTALTDSGLDRSKITTVKDTHFRSAYTIERYSSPLVLIRANEGLQSAFWNEGIIAYKDKLIGIHAPATDKNSLSKFYRELTNLRNVHKAFALLESTQLLVGRATALLKRDLDNLPWPNTGESWDLSAWEDVLFEELLTYMADYIRLGQKSKLLRETATNDQLSKYTSMYCQMLRGIHPNVQAGTAQRFQGLICQSIFFGDRPDFSLQTGCSEDLRKLIYVQRGAPLRTVRVLRFYQGNTILIVKPDRLRYWIQSTAIRDADESLVELQKQGF